MPHPAPAEIAWLVRPIGERAALRLIEELGGTTVHVAQVPTAGRLVDAIGMEAARALAVELGGQNLRIPLVKWWRARLYREAGMTYAAIALKLGCTEGAVHKHLRSAGMTNGPSPQAELPV